MLSFTVYLVILFVLASSSQAMVVELDQGSFAAVKQGVWLVEFYAPWCGICKNLAPVYEEAAVALHGKMNFAKVDGTVHTGLKKKYDVKGFPEIFFFRNGDYRKYRKSRTLEGFVDFAEAMAKPAVTSYSSLDALNEAVAKTPVTFLFTQGAGQDNTPESQVFQKLAVKLQGLYTFVKSEHAEILAEYAQSSSPQLVAIVERGDLPTFQGRWDVSELQTFIEANRLPWLSELSPQTFLDVTEDKSRLLAYTVISPSQDNRDYRKLLIDVAKQAKDYTFATIDSLQFERYVLSFGVDLNQLPALFVFNSEEDIYYKMVDIEGFLPSDVKNPAKIREFLTKVTDGEATYIHTIAWYNPNRYLKKLNKYIKELDLDEDSDIFEYLTYFVLFSFVLFGVIFHYLYNNQPHMKKDD